MIPRVIAVGTPGELASTVADWLIDQVAGTPGPFRLCLSGGSTPKAMFARLAEPARARRMAWDRLHVFWGDERFVPHSSPDSNAGEAMRLLFDRLAFPPGQLHPFADTGSAEDAAAAYQALLQREYGAETLDPARPLFDVNFLGLGEDGHTASLIPGQPVLEERVAWCAAVRHGRPEPRLTLTRPVLESARIAAFLVSGAAKAPILARLLAGEAGFPASAIAPVGQLLCFADQRALAG